MKFIAMISLRNLLRQKRRNILLGTAIAFGVMILIVANSFSTGITDILLNKIVVRIAGHITVAFNEKGGLCRTIFRDKEKMLSMVKNNVEGIGELEESLGVFCRVIGNGKSDNAVLVGFDFSLKLSEETRKEIEESFKMIEGDFSDLLQADVENPIILSQEKAKYLKVKKDDILRMRFTNLFGNDESARLTVIGIARNDNVFMQAVICGELEKVKKLMGYKPYEVANLNITLKDPQKNAIKQADQLHSALTPDLAVIKGRIQYGGKTENVLMLGLKTDDDSQEIIKKHITIVEDNKDTDLKKAVFINQGLSEKLGIEPEDIFKFTYKNKFEDKSKSIGTKSTGNKSRENKNTATRYTVKAIFKDNTLNNNDTNIILLNEEKFYDTYYKNLPEDISNLQETCIPDKSNPLYQALATEWILLDRTSNTEQLQKKLKQISGKKWHATTIDVRTMYESASEVLKLEQVLNLITVTAVLILFFIILIGVVNTLRMTIRERTREIGTIRAIGMQKKDVRNTFILESFFLAFFSSILGTFLAFIAMRLLSTITLELGDNPLSILLINGRLYFKPTFFNIISNIILILIIVAVTAYFPARRAANFSPATALRHYE